MARRPCMVSGYSLCMGCVIVILHICGSHTFTMSPGGAGLTLHWRSSRGCDLASFRSQSLRQGRHTTDLNRRAPPVLLSLRASQSQPRRGIMEGDSVTVIVKTASFTKQAVKAGVSADDLVGKVLSTREEEDMDMTFVTVQFVKEDGSEAFQASFIEDELERILEDGEVAEEVAPPLPLMDEELVAVSVLITIPKDYAAQRDECLQLVDAISGAEAQDVVAGVLVEGKWADAMLGVKQCSQLLLARGVPGVSAALTAGEAPPQDDFEIPPEVLDQVPGLPPLGL